MKKIYNKTELNANSYKELAIYCNNHGLRIVIDGDMIYTLTPREQLVDGVIVDNSLEYERKQLIEHINRYDKSAEVNSVVINGNSTWYNKDQRLSLKMRYESEITKPTTTLWVGDVAIQLSPLKGVEIINSINNYASEVYDVTHKCLNEVNQLSTLDDIKNYDFKSQYPTTLSFEL